MEDRYPANTDLGQRRAPANPYRQSNNANNVYMQNSPHSVSAARAAKKAAMPQTQSGTSPYMRDNTDAGTMPYMQNQSNTGTMPYMQGNQNTGVSPYTQEKQNTGVSPYMQGNQNTGVSPYTQEKQNTGVSPYTQNQTNTGVSPYETSQKNTVSDVQSEMTECSYKMGTLPSCAPLSAGYVPFQQENSPKYSAGDALTRGTLFPGLDLPYLNIVNKDHPYAGTPLGELMALGFVIKELNLYLDTHPNDTDALTMLHSMNELMAEGNEKYVKMYGPITISDLVSGDEYTWLNNPWPWDYNERPVNK